MNLEKITNPDVSTSHQSIYCYKGKVSPEEVAKKLETVGIKTIAKSSKDEVNGNLSLQYADSSMTTWCGYICKGEEKHTCVLLTVYGETVSPDNKFKQSRKNKLLAKQIGSKEEKQIDKLLRK